MSRMSELHHEQQTLKESYTPTREEYERDDCEEYDPEQREPYEGETRVIGRTLFEFNAGFRF